MVGNIYSYRLFKILTLLKVAFFEKSEATIKCQSGTYPRIFLENLHAHSQRKRMMSKKLSWWVIGERFIIYHALSKICHFDLFTFMTWGDYKCNKYIQQYVQMWGRGSPRKFAPTPFLLLFCSDHYDLWLIGLFHCFRALQNIFSHLLLLDLKLIRLGTYI